MAVAKKTTKKAPAKKAGAKKATKSKVTTKKAPAKRPSKVGVAVNKVQVVGKVTAEEAGRVLAWQTASGLNDKDACKTMGLSRNTFVKYRDDYRESRKPLPVVVNLALSALEDRIGAKAA